MLKVMLFLTMQKSLLPTGGSQENRYWKENWGNLLNPQARCLITIWRATCHGNWPWKKRMRRKDSTVAGGRRRQSHWERQHYSAQEHGGRAWPKGPFGSTDCEQQGAEEPDKQWTRNINGILAFLSSTVRIRDIFTIWYLILYFWNLKLTGICMKSVISESMYQLPQLYIISTLNKPCGLIKIQPTSSSSVWDFSKGWSLTTLQLEIRQGKSN